jgi:hypothetical protein
MFGNAFAAHAGLRECSRVLVLSRENRISAAEIACLLVCGGLAALAIGLFHPSLRLPGHAILRGALPMGMGFAIVPRRWSGSIMAIGALVAGMGMSAGGIGSFPPTAMLSVLALGPILDTALVGHCVGWLLYFRFALAGAVANLLALSLKLAGFQLGIETGGGGGGHVLWFGMPVVFTSYVLCGALAGLIGAALWFRFRVNDDLRRN